MSGGHFCRSLQAKRSIMLKKIGSPANPIIADAACNELDGKRYRPISEINWLAKCQTLGGNTMYQVWRKIGPTGEFSYLGGTGRKSFLDSTIPLGTSNVTYQLQAVRSSAIGPWSQYNVNFGVTSSGTISASVTQQPTMKAA